MDIIKAIDIVIAILLIASVVSGYMTGLVTKAAQLASLVAAYFIASFAADLLSPGLSGFINGKMESTAMPAGAFVADTAESIVHHAVFTIIFIISFIILRHAANIFKITSHLPVIGKLDRIGGAIAGFLVNFIIIYIICSLFFGIMPQDMLDNIGLTKKAIRDSVLLQAFY
ncbi:MAG: CvpA family protein [Lachnospiraceae bacterium]|nr:CvpA family protein [Lachnospiraceae bacterium]